MPTTDEIFDKVRQTLTDALGGDDDVVTAEARLSGDRAGLVAAIREMARRVEGPRQRDSGC